jgi:competence protein ComGF
MVPAEYLTLLEIITYDILRRDHAHQKENEHDLSDHTVADWGMFCRETMLELLEGSSEKIGGPNKTVEIDKSFRGNICEI